MQRDGEAACDNCGNTPIKWRRPSRAGTHEELCAGCAQRTLARDAGEFEAGALMLHTAIGIMRDAGATDEAIEGAAMQSIQSTHGYLPWDDVPGLREEVDHDQRQYPLQPVITAARVPVPA